MTKRAREAIEESDVIVGYKTYVDLIKDIIRGKEVISTGMTEEVSRAQEAVKQAERGKTSLSSQAEMPGCTEWLGLFTRC